MTLKIAIVILNWNGQKFLEKFLPNVLANSLAPNVEVYVADNGSTDNSVEYISSNFKEVQQILLFQNYGFAEGYNLALKQVNADYYVLLNSDVEVTPNWIAPVIEFMEANTQVGACMPKILAYHNKQKFEYAGAAGGYIDRFGFPFCRGRVLYTVEDDLGQYNNIQEIFWATGACMFVKANLFFQFGGFDAMFFAHMEEIDLCWRMKNGGYKIYYIPSSTVYHVGGGSLAVENPRKTYLNYRNNLFLLYKNLPKLQLVAVLFARWGFDLLSLIKYLLTIKPKHALAVFKAHVHFYKKLPHLQGYRNKQTHPYRLNINEIYRGSIIVYYYLKSKIAPDMNSGYRNI